MTPTYRLVKGAAGPVREHTVGLRAAVWLHLDAERV